MKAAAYYILDGGDSVPHPRRDQLARYKDGIVPAQSIAHGFRAPPRRSRAPRGFGSDAQFQPGDSAVRAWTDRQPSRRPPTISAAALSGLSVSERGDGAERGRLISPSGSTCPPVEWSWKETSPLPSPAARTKAAVSRHGPPVPGEAALDRRREYAPEFELVGARSACAAANLDAIAATHGSEPWMCSRPTDRRWTEKMVGICLGETG